MEVFRMKLLLAVPLIALLIGCNLQPDNPLIGATRSGDTKAIATLLAGGADPNQRWGVKQFPSFVKPIPVFRARQATYSWPLSMICAPNGG